MKKILKITVFLLAAVIMMGICASADNTSDTQYKNAVKVLTEMNIIPVVDENDDFSAERYVTREEFCVYLSRAFKFTQSTETKQIFTDVETTDALYPYIKALYEKGIVSGYGGAFRPDDIISYNEAIKILVSTLNYDYADMLGGYPMGYVRIAESIDIDENVIKSDKITKGAAAQLIYNALAAPLMEFSHITGDDIVFTKSDDETAFSVMYDIYEDEGVILANGRSTFVSGKTPYDYDEVLIGNDFYKTGTTGAEKLLGHKVKFIYREKEDDTFELVAILDDRAEEFVLQSEDIISFLDGKYTYETADGKRKTVRLSDDFLIMYNFGYPQTGFSTTMMKPTRGSVRLVRNSKSGAYDAVIIENYVNYAADSVDVLGEKIYGKNNDVLPLAGKEYIILDPNGNKLTLESINEWNIVSALTSSDGNNVVVYVSNQAITGVAETIESGTHGKITIDGTEYKADSFATSNVKMGEEASFYLDYNGRIAAVFAVKTTDLMYGYLLRADIDLTSPQEKVYVKVFDQDGTINRYYLSDRARVNDIRHLTTEETKNSLQVTEKIIKYRKDSKGEINRIYTYDASSDKYVHKLLDGTAYWNWQQRRFAGDGGSGTVIGQATLVPNPVVFVIPTGAEPEKYEVRDISVLRDDKQDTVKIYTMGDNVYGECVVKTAAGTGYNGRLAIVKKIRKSINEDNEETVQIDCLHAGQEQQYMLASADVLTNKKDGTPLSIAIANGDILRLAFDNNNQVIEIEPVYDVSNPNGYLLSNPSNTEAGLRSPSRILFGYAYDKTDGLLKVAQTIPSTGTPNTENALLSGFGIYVIDTRADSTRPEVRIGSDDDILSYTRVNNACSKLLMVTDYANPRDIIVIK